MSRLPDGMPREAVIDTSAISDNVRHLRRLTGVEVIAVVKADAYGHGAARAATAALAGGASRLGVAEIPEALALRRAGIDAPILAWL
ncbi:MAG TPA: alanine racemase, partial [Microbacterium sp.]|nr:alanine racemase [Microbacterium sp.]